MENLNKADEEQKIIEKYERYDKIINVVFIVLDSAIWAVGITYCLYLVWDAYKTIKG